MRILVGTVEIAGGLLDWADAFRQLGHQVTTVISMRNSLYPAYQYDIDLKPERKIPWPKWIEKRCHPLVLRPREALDCTANDLRLLRLIAGHDLFVFQWGGISLTEGNREFPLLKWLGKKILSIFCGSDVRHASSYLKHYRDHELSPAFAEQVKCNMVNFLRPLRATRMAERFSDLILSRPDQSNLGIRPYMTIWLPLRLANFRCQIPGRQVPLVVHAPSRRNIKGTDQILAILEQLKKEGVPFELKVLHGVPNEEVLETLTKADVVVDQLFMGGYGKLGLESMASGCALVTRAFDAYWAYCPDQPIWHIEMGNLYPQLKRILTDRELRLRLARQGREYVERQHDHVAVARRVLDMVRRPRLPDYDFYPAYFAREFRLEDGEVIPAGLRRMTAEIAQRWGLPEGVDPRDLIARGLMSWGGLDRSRPIPRWSAEQLARQHCVC